MGGIIDTIQRLFSRSSDKSDTQSKGQIDPEEAKAIIKGTDNCSGAVTVQEELQEWQRQYAEDFHDYLTVEEALQTYQRAQNTLSRLERITTADDSLDDDVSEAAAVLANNIKQVCEFIENKEEYNDKWLKAMEDRHAEELNDYFDDDNLTHTQQQLEAIFSNDNFNRVNAAAGTGKTTTFGRRVHFILSEYDEISEEDLFAITFTRNGVSEMEAELEQTFGITDVEVSTINSYSKSVSEQQYDDLEFIVGEAKNTEISAIWREVTESERFVDTYERFLEAWKEEYYNPNNFEIVKGVYDGFVNKSGVTLGGEDVFFDSIPEEGLAHEAIARYLMEREIKYDYQVHVDWAHAPDGGFVLDFRLVDDDTAETIYIEYCTSDITKESRPNYRNRHSEHPETVKRLFRPKEHLETDVSDKTVVVLDGNAILDGRSDDFDWNSRNRKRQFKQDIQAALDNQLQQTSVELDSSISDNELIDYVYDNKVLCRDVVEKISEFITQARVREWNPEEASSNVEEYLATQPDIEDGVPEFCQLALAAYQQFITVFDNRTKTDFHGSVVLTRDLLEDGKVDDEFLYQYIFIDEMQDLNQVQFGVIKALSQQLGDIRVFGVGDDWQSIFGFQGARPDLFINFGDVLEAGVYDGLPKPVEVFTTENQYLSSYESFVDTRLEDNFRCPDTIVQASNELIRNNDIRTEKDPDGAPNGNKIRIHHLGCDTYEYKLNESMKQKIVELIEESEYKPADIQILLRNKDGDPHFYYGLKNAIPNAVDIRTAHDAKGSEAEHVIIPKVIEKGGYPSLKSDFWLQPIKRPPEVYEEKEKYQIEEERRLFYVALTRAKTKLDILTVQGAASLFIDEIPEKLSIHDRPISDDALEEIEDEGESRQTVTGAVNAKFSDNYATFDWDDGALIDINMYDATEEQIQQIDELHKKDVDVILENCGIEYRKQDGIKRLQLQLDEDVLIETQ